jgi:Uma2 family endonuclease
MSIADLPLLPDVDISIQPVHRPLTASDLEAFPSELPSGPVDYELDNGRLVLIMAPPGDVHGAAQSNIVAYLKFSGEFKNHGQARTETGLILWRNPDRVVTPDVMFAASKSLPIHKSPEGYWETIPELVVEVRSKNDSASFIRRKVEHYLKAGVQVVWLVEPELKSITIHRPNGDPIALSTDGVLTLEGIIPDFSLALSDIFRD